MTGMIPKMDLGEMGFLFCDLLFSLNNPLSGVKNLTEISLERFMVYIVLKSHMLIPH